MKSGSFSYSCSQCGACCVAPDISTLKKPVGVPCPHLDSSHRCSIYENRPAVCRNYLPDELCKIIAAPTLEERVKKYLTLFGIPPASQVTFALCLLIYSLSFVA